MYRHQPPGCVHPFEPNPGGESRGIAFLPPPPPAPQHRAKGRLTILKCLKRNELPREQPPLSRGADRRWPASPIVGVKAAHGIHHGSAGASQARVLAALLLQSRGARRTENTALGLIHFYPCRVLACAHKQNAFFKMFEVYLI